MGRHKFLELSTRKGGYKNERAAKSDKQREGERGGEGDIIEEAHIPARRWESFAVGLSTEETSYTLCLTVWTGRTRVCFHTIRSRNQRIKCLISTFCPVTKMTTPIVCH